MHACTPYTFCIYTCRFDNPCRKVAIGCRKIRGAEFLEDLRYIHIVGFGWSIDDVYDCVGLCPIMTYNVVSFPDPTPMRGKGSGVLRAISWAFRMQNSHVILIIVMATHCLVCGSRMQQHCGLICAAGALSHEKSHAVNLIGTPEIRTATSSSPRNHSKYTRPSSPCRGGVWDRDYLQCSHGC